MRREREVDVAPAFARQSRVDAGPYVALTVRDTGCGMSPDVLSHVFEPFFTTKPIGKGTGLGLAMVYGIVKQSGGYVRIESVPGEGTTVTIYLPSVGDVALAEPSATEVTPRCNGTETILLVEDDPGVRQLMQRTLAGCGYTVFAASTATEAVAFATVTTSPLELLLSDVIMPDLSGPDVAQRVVRRHPQMKVLYVSGFISESVLGSGTLSRHAAFLPKPFTAHALCMKVRECLDTPS